MQLGQQNYQKRVGTLKEKKKNDKYGKIFR